MARFALLKQQPEPDTLEPLVVPSLESVDPEYADLIARRDELERKRVELTAEHASLYQQCVDITQAEFERNARVGALLDGAVGEQPDPAPHQRCNELAREVGDIARALEVLARRIHDGRLRASAKVCELVAPEHTRRVREICDLLVKLNAAFSSYNDFAAALNAANIHWSSTLHPMAAPEFGRPNTRACLASAFLNKARRAGFVSESEIPDKLRY